MATLTDAEILTQVKAAMGITGDYQDSTLTVYIADVQAFMVDAGVDESVVNSDAAIGCITRGVIDMWDYGSGSGSFSEIFRMRLIQLTKENADVQANQSSSDDDSL